ncbi:MAG: helix-turn-helix transcriptional regulator [Paracoccaceae bacterium]
MQPTRPAALSAPVAKNALGIVALIGLQALCAVVFVGDLIADAIADGGKVFTDVHLWVEAAATLTLIAAIAIEIPVLRRLMAREVRLRQSLNMAKAAVEEVIAAHFETWALSPSERDVAHFLVRGMSIAETAQLRGSAEGTVKAHLNAIYRKSGTRNRAELMSLLIDAMMGADAEAREPKG